jgi:hypothetical protein
MKEALAQVFVEPGIWISSPIGEPFQIDLPHVPRQGEVFEIAGQKLKVVSIIYHPLTMESGRVNKCSVEIVLTRPPVINNPEQLFGTAF